MKTAQQLEEELFDLYDEKDIDEVDEELKAKFNAHYADEDYDDAVEDEDGNTVYLIKRIYDIDGYTVRFTYAADDCVVRCIYVY